MASLSEQNSPLIGFTSKIGSDTHPVLSGASLAYSGSNSHSSSSSRGRSPTGSFIAWLTHVRLSRLIFLLLVIVVTVALIAHYYISNVGGVGVEDDGTLLLQGSWKGRKKLEKDHATKEELEGQIVDLKFRVDELVRIKTSVNNELRDLESKRQTLQAEITQYHVYIDKLKSSYEAKKKELDHIQTSIEQARLRHREAVAAATPEIQAPRRIAPPEESHETLEMPSVESTSRCSVDDGVNCFDHSRCSVSSGFPVYAYHPEEFSPSFGSSSAFILSSFTRSLQLNPHSTFDDRGACLFMLLVGQPNHVVVGDPKPKSVERRLKLLPHWKGDGRNHLLVDLRILANSSASVLDSVDKGRAMVASPTFTPSSPFRRGFDVVLPPLLTPRSHGDVWTDLPSMLPARKSVFISFQGVQTKEAKLLKNSESVITSMRKTLTDLNQNPTPDICEIDFNCASDPTFGEDRQLTGPYWTIDEWRLCHSHMKRGQLLANSTFVVIIAPQLLPSSSPSSSSSDTAPNVGASNRRRSRRGDASIFESVDDKLKDKSSSPSSTAWTQLSTPSFAIRFAEAIKFGAVPVILGNKDSYILPFNDVIDWTEVAIRLPLARVTELHFILRTFSDGDILRRRRQGRRIYESYFSTTEAMFNSLVALYRTRLNLPPLVVQSEPSPSVFNASFTPLKSEPVSPEVEGGEDSLGPVEPPFPSTAFVRNFSLDYRHVWNEQFDPFHLYPSLPWDPTLSSDAKFVGSSHGFRPIGQGSGGSGKEFTEALGGNHPREQFTIVMLTYEREAVLMNALQRLAGLPHLNKVVVVWNSPKAPAADLKWPEITVPYVVVRTHKNSLNNRFLPFDSIETDAILSIDDDAHLRHDEILFGFRVWRESRDRLVGFPGRFHAYDSVNRVWQYNSNYSCELSMVLTGAAFLHKYYMYSYSYLMPAAIRDIVDEYINCEDIAMNFLIAHLTRKPPIKVTSRWTFRCPGCPVALSSDDSHFQERHRCINRFAAIYGYMPLLNTQFRVDSVLFKTRLPHDKQKCFKYI